MTARSRTTRAAKSFAGMAALLVAAAGFASAAKAQFGLPGLLVLPEDDFIWIWGNRERAEAGRASDMSMTTLDQGFRCELNARFSASNNLSMPEIREFEGNLRTSPFFIETVANAMYQLELRRDIDWAVLQCVKLSETEDREAQAEHEAKLRERAERRRDRRRERDRRERDGESSEPDWRDL